MEKLVRAGYSQEDARAEAVRRFDQVDVVKRAMARELARREGRTRMTDRIDKLRQDAGYALRQLLRSPGFAIVTVLTLTLAIGATTAIFSVVDGILFRPLPYEEPEELVRIWSDYTRRGGPADEWPNFPNLWNLREQGRSFEALGIWAGGGGTLTGRGPAERVSGTSVDHHLLAGVLRVEPVLGRGFLPEDDRPGAPGTAILSHGFWQRRFGGDAGILGETLVLNGQPYTIIGVMGEDFRPSFADGTDLWTPLRMDITAHACGRGNACLFGMARLAEGVDLEAARREGDDLGRRFEEEDPEANAGLRWNFQPLQADLVADARTGLLVLLGAALCMLLIACVNEANLLLARGTSRRSELAVRSALGAGQGRIVAQLLTESVLLALIGGAVGVGVTYALTDVLVALAPAGTPRIDEVAVNGRVLGFAAGATLLAGLLFGLFPALRGSGNHLLDALREGGRGDTGSGGARARQALVVAQVALALVLLVGSGLLIRSFENLRSVELGFDPEGVLAFQVSLPAADYENAAALRAFHSAVHERLTALPGVSSVGATGSLPLAGFNGDMGFTIEGRPVPPPGTSQAVWYREVTPPLLQTLRIAIVRGRGIEAGDDEQAPRVVVVNEALARRYFPDFDPIGQRLNFNDPDEPIWWEIVGVAGDVKHFGIRGEARDALYIPFSQMATRTMFYALRSDRDLTALAAEVRGALSELDPNLAAARLEPFATYAGDAVAPDRFVTMLLLLFAAVAMTLAAVGLYGVVSYQVNGRLREMGVRMALGARGGEVAALVVRRSLAVVAIGLLIGLAGALSLTRFMESLLFEISATDPLTFVAVAAVLTAAATLAAALPARRAAAVDPVEVLRAE